MGRVGKDAGSRVGRILFQDEDMICVSLSGRLQCIKFNSCYDAVVSDNGVGFTVEFQYAGSGRGHNSAERLCCEYSLCAAGAQHFLGGPKLCNEVSSDLPPYPLP